MRTCCIVYSVGASSLYCLLDVDWGCQWAIPSTAPASLWPDAPNAPGLSRCPLVVHMLITRLCWNVVAVLVVVVVVVAVAVAVAVAAAAAAAVVVVGGAGRVRDGMTSQHAKASSIVSSRVHGLTYEFAIGLAVFEATLGIFVSPWANGKAPNKSRYVHDALYFYSSCAASYLGISLSARGRMGRHRTTAATPRMPCSFIAVAGPKLFRSKFVSPWAHWKAPNNSRYAQDAV